MKNAPVKIPGAFLYGAEKEKADIKRDAGRIFTGK